MELTVNERIDNNIGMIRKVKVQDILKVKTGKHDANHASQDGKFKFFTCALEPFWADTFSFDDEVLILPGNGANVGKVLYYDGKLEAYQRTYILHEIKANVRYLFYYFEKYWIRQITKKQVGSATNYIKIDDIMSFEILLPDFATQQKIAKILDTADQLCQYNKQLIKKYDALIQSLFLEMFGDIKSNKKKWELKPFEYFAKFDTRMTSDFDKYANQPHIGIANIEKETGKLINYKLISEENLSSGKYIFNESHIIYSKIRPNLNKVALPDFSGLCSADSYPLKVIKENTNRIFFAYVLRSDSFVDFILTHSTRTNIPKANKDQMKKYIGITPPINLQNQFAERVQMIETQKQQAQEAMVKSEDLFQSLLQRAFKGELN